MKKIETAGIVGLGALGTMYAHILTKSLGRDRVFVYAENAAAHRNGIPVRMVVFVNQTHSPQSVCGGIIEGTLGPSAFIHRFHLLQGMKKARHRKSRGAMLWHIIFLYNHFPGAILLYPKPQCPQSRQ